MSSAFAPTRPQGDQASRLRELVTALRAPDEPRRGATPNGPTPDRAIPMLAITSGKGGVGKTSLAVNLSIALTARGRRVGLIDADPGTANADVLLGIAPNRRLDRLREGDALDQLAVEAPGGIMLVPGIVGAIGVAASSPIVRSKLLAALGQLNERCDVLIVDTGAGIGSAVTEFVRAADHTILVATPEPTSVIDAYALLKVVQRRRNKHETADQADREVACSVVVNQVHSRAEADAVGGRLAAAAERFLGSSVGTLGSIPWDSAVTKAVKAGVPLMIGSPRRSAAKAIRGIADVVMLGVLNAHESA